MTLRGTRANTYTRRRARNGASGRHEGSEDVDLPGRRSARERPSQVPVTQAGLSRLRVRRPRITAVTASIAPI